MTVSALTDRSGNALTAFTGNALTYGFVIPPPIIPPPPPSPPPPSPPGPPGPNFTAAVPYYPGQEWQAWDRAENDRRRGSL